MAYTYDQLLQMGATPGAPTASPQATGKGYSYDELVKMGAKSGGSTGAFSTPAPVLPPPSPQKQEDIQSAQKYGAFMPADTQATGVGGALGEAGKVVANMAPSAFNFAKGVIDFLNPISTVNKVKQAVTEFGGLAKDVGGYGNALKATIGGLPKAAYESLVPEAGRAILKGDIDTAHRAIVNDPVGQIAPFLLAAKGGANILDRTGLTKGAEAGFDTSISKIAQPVIKPISAAATGVKNFVGGATKFVTAQATGLNPETISQVIKTPESFGKEVRGTIDRATLGKEVQSTLNKKASVLAETGEAYQPIREGGSVVKVSKTWLDSTIKDLTGLDIEKIKAPEIKTPAGEEPTIQIGQKPAITGGKYKITGTGSSVLRDASDIRAVQHLYDLWKPVFDKGKMDANEFLNFRTDLAKISKFERQIGKSQPLEAMAQLTRGRFNEAYRPQLEGLDALDKEFGGQTLELKRLSKGFVDKNGNLTDSAINRIANATGKGKDLLLNRLEETVPGITQKIKTLKAVEDIQAASGIKVGTYGRAAMTGGAFFLGGPIQAVITAIMTSPEMAVPILRRYGLIKNSGAVKAVMNVLRSGAGAINQLPNKTPQILKEEVKFPGAFSSKATAGK